VNPLFIGLDLGTSAVKVGLFDSAGCAIRLERRGYPLHTPQSRWVEQEPSDWWEAIVCALRDVLSGTDTRDVVALGLTGQTPGHVLVAADGAALGRAIIWSDQRATAEADWLTQHITPDQAREWTGSASIFDVTQPPARLLWLKNNRPAAWSRARAILQPKDFVAMRLTGQTATDHHSAYALYNAQSRCYHPDYLELLGIEPRKLPVVLSPTARAGVVTQEAAASTGLCAGTPIVIGTIDAWCDILGCGGTVPGQAVDVAGTSEVVALVARRLLDGDGSGLAAGYGIFATPLLEDLFWVGGPMQGGGGTLLWWARGFCQQQDVESLAAEAETVRPAADGPFFLPYLRGERAPVWDSRARGAFVGLTDRHTRASCTRAVYEGMAFAVRDILERSQAATGLRATSLRVTGGASRSSFWNQIKADITGLPVQPMLVSDAGCLGAALLGALGVESFPNLASAAASMVHPATEYMPQVDRVGLYNSRFATWRRVYPALKPLFQ
jgi:xylulokinase